MFSIPGKEIRYLQQRGFLSKSFNHDTIREDLHTDECWADTFWRRKLKHSIRNDPELQYLNEMQLSNKSRFENVLEIGSGYGRVTHKINKLDLIKNLTGIEICSGFRSYVEQYTIEVMEGIDDPIRSLFEDFFTSNNIKLNSFDLILLPMNTLPSFNWYQLPKIFQRIEDLLTDHGQFIFTTYPETASFGGEKYHGELLVDPENIEQIPIGIEFFNMKSKKHSWGEESVTYSKYIYLDQDYPEDIRYFRTSRTIYKQNSFEQLLRDTGLIIKEARKLDHSVVIRIEKVI